MKRMAILLAAVTMLMVTACSSSKGVKEELVDENGNVLVWADCFSVIQDYVGDQKLYERLFDICQAQDPVGYEEWKNRVTSKIKLSK